MLPKERVRANIYKSLLEEEKRKNKRMSIFSVGLFFVGVVTMSSYNLFIGSDTSTISTSNNFALSEKTNQDDLMTSIYDMSSITTRKTVEINPDDLFLSSAQI